MRPETLLPQTFYGLVREQLPMIEREMARGVRLADLLKALPVADRSMATFRNALFRARRRVRRGRAKAEHLAVLPIAAREPSNTQATGQSVRPAPQIAPKAADASQKPRRAEPAPQTAGVAASPRRIVLRTQRDFLHLVHSTDDREFI
jgi:hypothetical protein